MHLLCIYSYFHNIYKIFYAYTHVISHTSQNLSLCKYEFQAVAKVWWNFQLFLTIDHIVEMEIYMDVEISL